MPDRRISINRPGGRVLCIRIGKPAAGRPSARPAVPASFSAAPPSDPDAADAHWEAIAARYEEVLPDDVFDLESAGVSTFAARARKSKAKAGDSSSSKSRAARAGTAHARVPHDESKHPRGEGGRFKVKAGKETAPKARKDPATGKVAARATFPARSRRANGRGTKAQRKKLADSLKAARGAAPRGMPARAALVARARGLRESRNTAGRTAWQVKAKDYEVAKATAKVKAVAKSTAKAAAKATPKTSTKQKPIAAVRAKTPPKPASASGKDGKDTPVRDLRKHLESLGPDARRLPETLKWIEKNQTAKPVDVKEHGMERAEAMHSIEFDGMRIRYPASAPLDFNHPAARTISGLLAGPPLSKSLTRHTTDVYHTNQANKQDPYWADRYGADPANFKSAGSGGDGKVVIYNGEGGSSFVLTHELGHNMATGRYGATTPEFRTDFFRASKTESAPSDYGKHSLAEDFAESVRLHATEPETLRRVAPERYAVIDRMLKDESYGG